MDARAAVAAMPIDRSRAAAAPEPIPIHEPAPIKPAEPVEAVQPAPEPEPAVVAAAVAEVAASKPTSIAASGQAGSAASDEPEEQPARPVAVEVAKIPELVAAAVSASGAGRPISLEPILAAVGVMDGVFDTDVPLGPVGESQHQPTGDELLAAAEAADLAGDNTTLHSLLLWTARAYAREGRFEAALDAAHRLLQRTPGDVDAHLVLVELYVARDWNGLAAEKLALLGRLAQLSNDEETRQRLCAVAGRAFPKDERLGALCA
jgi:hypothetical protein